MFPNALLTLMRVILFVLTLTAVLGCNRQAPTETPTQAAEYRQTSLDTTIMAAMHKTWTNPGISLGRLIDSLHINTTQLSVHITKSAYELGVYHNNKLLKNYPVVFGDPLGDKLREGDKRTPEGIFKIRSKYPHKSWTRFIWIDYPNNESWKKHKAAKANGLIPRDASIGGEIGIHGVPPGYDEAVDYRQNWTLGCISMKNKDLIELYPFITTNTVIEIRK
jgi:murein L,D-transpeptidase YafK